MNNLYQICSDCMFLIVQIFIAYWELFVKHQILFVELMFYVHHCFSFLSHQFYFCGHGGPNVIVNVMLLHLLAKPNTPNLRKQKYNLQIAGNIYFKLMFQSHFFAQN